MSSDVRLSCRFIGRTLLRSSLIALLLVTATVAQNVEPVAAPLPQLSASDLETQLKKAQESADLDEDAKKTVVETYQQALEHLKKAAEFRSKLEGIESADDEAERKLRELKDQLARPEVDPAPEVPPNATLAQLEQKAVEQQDNLAKARERLKNLEDEQRHRAQRRQDVPNLISRAEESLGKIQAALAPDAQPQSNDPPPLNEARRANLLAKQERSTSELRFLRSELSSYARRAELLTARLAHENRRFSHQEKLDKAWRELVARRRTAEAAVQRAEAAEQVSQYELQELRGLAERNQALTEARQDIASKLARTKDDVDVLESWKKSLVDTLTEAEERESTGLTPYMGYWLRDHRKKLALTPPIESDTAEIPAVQINRFKWRDEVKQISDADSYSEKIVAEIEAPTTFPKEEIKAEIVKLLSVREKILTDLLKDAATYFERLARLDLLNGEISRESRKLAEFIDQRVLWIRSTDFVSLEDIRYDWDAINRLFSAETIQASRAAVTETFREAPVSLALPIFGLLAILLAGPTLRRRLAAVGVLASKSRTAKFSHTATALLATLGLTIFWPGVLWLSAWCFRVAAPNYGSPELALAFSTGLFTAGTVFWTFDLLRQVCRPKGLAEAHFGWGRAGILRLRSDTTWLLFILTPHAFLAAVLRLDSLDPDRAAVGRIPFVLATLAIAIYTTRVFHPRKGILHFYLERYPQSWFARLRHLVTIFAVGMPVALVILAGTGYYFTATELSESYLETVWFFLLLLLLQALSLRWLLLERRKLVIEQALAKREVAKKVREERRQADNDDPSNPESPTDPAPPPEEDIDLGAVNVQSNQLLRMCFAVAFLGGLWVLWSNVLPALGILDNVKLFWTKPGPVGETSIPVTLGDLGFALFAGVVSIAGARNFPGFLQMTVFQRAPIDHGARYALTTITRYVILLGGLIFAFSLIGIGWNRVQWLAAGLTVGLGFGLQEIFANFISGLVLLFERPIRVGDIVTVGNVSGTVTQIRTRATVIRDWNRKELLVPNKELITGQVVNWTLNDTVARVLIPVGIAYGSDTARAQELLLEVTRQHPNVLEDPAPSAFFVAFGASTLDYEVRAYLASVNHLLSTRHELLTAIDQAFRKESIEIAFPQLDVHFHTQPPAERDPSGEIEKVRQSVVKRGP